MKKKWREILILAGVVWAFIYFVGGYAGRIVGPDEAAAGFGPLAIAIAIRLIFPAK
jgi:hypothetical protein